MLITAEPLAHVCDISPAIIVRAMEEIRRNWYLWDEVTHRQDYPGSAHAPTKAIYLRWAAEWTPASIFESLSAEWCDSSAILTQTTAIVRAVLEAVGAMELGRVMLVNLQPGGRIVPHWDAGLYADYFDRFHVSIQSDEGNAFAVDDAKVHMAEGEAWWFNHQLEHTVHNGSQQDRIHLIIDCVAPKYRAMRKGT